MAASMPRRCSSCSRECTTSAPAISTPSALWPHVQAALRWIDEYGDRDSDGFVEYAARSERGLSNQGWKDSEDSVFHADGRLAAGPIALSEVQGYVFGAKRLADRLAGALGFGPLAETLRNEAAALQERFEAAFWCADLSTYALALDGAKRPCRVRSSNAGQVLLSGLASPERAAARPVSWTVTASPAGASARRGDGSALQSHVVSQRLGVAARQCADRARVRPIRFERSHPAAVRGHVRCRELHGSASPARTVLWVSARAGQGPTSYPVACSPQAWASATPFALLQACLGLSFDPAGERVRFRQPRLPDFLDQVVIRNLEVGDSRFDIMLRRYGGDVSVNVLDRRGDGRIAITL